MIYMRQIIFSLLFLSVVTGSALAQNDANRTITTKIADLLAKTPAEEAVQLKANAAAFADLGEQGIVELVKRLNEGGDNTKLHYAINGFAYAATEAGKEAWRALAVKAYSTALPQLTNDEAKLFIISQLEHVGKDDAIAVLIPFLKNDRLSDASSRALAAIGSEASEKALLSALGSASGNPQLSIVEALGYTKSKSAVPAISALTTAADPKLAKTALHALAEIADPASLKILSDAAAKSGYTYDVTNATSSYLQYLNGLAASGQSAEALKAARELLKKSASDGVVHTRTAALKIITDIDGTASIKLLTDAMKDKNAQYREAALKFAQPYLNDVNTVQWLKTFGKSSAPAQAEMIKMFGTNDVKSALPAVLKALGSKNDAVKLAAIAASGKIGQQEALPSLLGLLTTANEQEASAVQSALMSMKGGNVMSSAGNALAGASPAGKAALINILGARGDNSRVTDVLSMINSNDAVVSAAARSAIKQMAGPDQIDQLYPLLLAAKDKKETGELQEAMISALKGIPGENDRNTTALDMLNKVPASQKSKFYNVLSGIGGKANLQTVGDAFANGNDETKQAVISALSDWKGGLATYQLYKILKQPGSNDYAKAIADGYIKQISISDNTDDEKLIMLRDAMEYAQTAGQKKAILSQIGKCKTLPALLYAGEFLDNQELQSVASSAVMNIALGSKNIYGDNVRALLEKTITKLKGSEATYEAEALHKHIAAMPQCKGFVPLFNGKDLTGWKGLVANPIERAKMDEKTLAAAQVKADEEMRTGWSVRDGLLVFNGHGNNLCTDKKYGDFEMYVDWKITPQGDAGIYLRGTPQVQIWDTSRVDVGAQVGSGGLYNNLKNESKPLVLADNAIGDWNTFHIIMVGDLVTVYLNGKLVVNGVPLENYWDRNLPIFPEEQIELQAHGTYVAYRDIYLREIPRPTPYTLTDEEKKEGYKVLFDGTSLHEWTGNKTAYTIEDGNIAVYPKRGGNGNLYTNDEYSDFIYRFEFKLTPGANNGVGIRAPLKGDAAYEGMEIQILDNDADIYKDLKPYQYHGSVYGIIPAKRGYLKPAGEWNQEEIEAKGNHIKVTLNGTVILDGDIAEATKNGTADHREHPGLFNKSGHIGFLGHGDILYFRNIRVRDLTKPVAPVTKSTRKAKKKK